ncbi:MAG: TatD family hydrolase [Candidatus Bathyarchaeia archaeon]
MKYVDAHIHLSDTEYNGKIDEIIKDAKQSNVVALVSNSMDLESCLQTLRLAKEYPNHVYAALGIHPWNVKSLKENELQNTLDLIVKEAGEDKIVAVGEIGLDFQYVKKEEDKDSQLKVFREMLAVAEKLSLPAIIHSRGTTQEIMDILPSYRIKKVLFHWFSRPIELLNKIVEKGYFITEGPPTAYSKRTKEIVEKTPLTHLLTETDGPVRFFGPPFKGSLTTPSFIPVVVEAIAKVKNMDKEEVGEQIIKNFSEFFCINL